MAKLALTLACGDYDRTLPLRTGAVRLEGVELEVLPLEPEEMFYRMARRRDFDAAEFSLATYTVLRGRGEPLVAIPVFPSFAFRHSAIFVRDAAGIREPRDLVGKRVGVPKYHMTAAVWIRGILEDEYGVSPGDLEWVEGGEGAAVKEVDVTLPAGLRHRTVPGDRTLGQLLAAGELDAFIGARRPAGAGAGVRRLFPDFRRVERAYYERTGIFPIMHTVVLKEELARAAPVAPRGALRGVRRGQAHRVSPRRGHRGPPVRPAVAGGGGGGDASADGRRPVPLRGPPDPQDGGDPRRILVPAGSRSAPTLGRRAVLGVLARDVAPEPIECAAGRPMAAG